MSFNNTPVSEQLVDELVEMVLYIANTNKAIVEDYKAVYGNNWESTSCDYALQDLKITMLECSDNKVVVDGFKKITEERRQDTGKDGGAPSPKEILEFLTEPSRNLFLNKVVLEPKTYSFVRELGHGQTGKVDEVLYRNGSFERHFARKTCETIKDIARFEREILTLATLNHSGIVGIIDAEFSEKSAWYVMDLIEGKRLCDYEGSFWEKHKIVSDLLESVAYLHKNAIIHRDLKPENIMIRESDGRPVIVDFGSSYSRRFSTITSTRVGQTMGYFGPEVQSDPNSSRLAQNDIFACGVIAYELLMGTRPNPADYSPLAVDDLDLNLLENLNKVLQKAMQYKVKDRYESAEEMLEQWKKHRPGEGYAEVRLSLDLDSWQEEIRIFHTLETDKLSLPEKIVCEILLQYFNAKTKTSLKMKSISFLYKHERLGWDLYGAGCCGAFIIDDESKKREIGESVINKALTECLPLLLQALDLHEDRVLECRGFYYEGENLEEYDYDRDECYLSSDEEGRVTLFVENKKNDTNF